MPRVEIHVDQLRSRGRLLQQLLRPLARQSSVGPAWQNRTGPSSWVIAMHDGSPPVSDHLAWRFATFVPHVRAGYYESWIPLGEGLWCLDRAYLHVYKTISGTAEEKDFVFLHCDPNEPADTRHGPYKRGPHLHVRAAEPPLPRAHIALMGRQALDLCMSSVDALTDALGWAVGMLKDQVLDPMWEDSVG
jgi:hypothetical protein